MSTTLDPHAGQSVLASGAALTDARLVAILLHGRGASAEDILGLASDLRLTDVAYLAPQAAGNTWYPYSFLTPMEKNEPSLSSALGTVAALVAHLGERGVSPERVALMGFSQGACLALELRGPSCAPLRVRRRVQRRLDWAAGHATGLCRLVRRHRHLPRLQRHRSAHPARARQGVG